MPKAVPSLKDAKPSFKRHLNHTDDTDNLNIPPAKSTRNCHIAPGEKEGNGRSHYACGTRKSTTPCSGTQSQKPRPSITLRRPTQPTPGQDVMFRLGQPDCSRLNGMRATSTPGAADMTWQGRPCLDMERVDSFNAHVASKTGLEPPRSPSSQMLRPDPPSSPRDPISPPARPVDVSAQDGLDDSPTWQSADRHDPDAAALDVSANNKASASNGLINKLLQELDEVRTEFATAGQELIPANVRALEARLDAYMVPLRDLTGLCREQRGRVRNAMDSLGGFLIDR